MGEAVIRHLGVAIVFLSALPALALAQPVGQPIVERLDFEELAPTCVASVTRSDWGAGPILVHGKSPRGWGETNVAVVMDTRDPGRDTDLEIPRYGNALIISKIRPNPPAAAEKAWSDGWVAPPTDDDSLHGGLLSFDFSHLGSVTFYGLSLLDHDDPYPAVIRIHGEAPELRALLEAVPPGEDGKPPHLDLFYQPRSWWRDWLTPQRRSAVLNPPDADHDFYRLQIAPIPSPGKASEIDVRALRGRGRESRAHIGKEPRLTQGISGVHKIEVKLGGSAAVDRIEFARGARPRQDGSFVGLFKKIQPYLTAHVQPELEQLAQEYVDEWERLGTQPEQTVRADLQRSLDLLEEDLLGVPPDPDTNSQGARGILDCRELHCGCPQLRPLRAWIRDRLTALRTRVASATDQQLLTPYQSAHRTAIRVAALAPAAFLDQAEPESGTFWEQFIDEGAKILRGTASKVAKLWVDLTLDQDQLAASDAPQCSSYGVVPKDQKAGQEELVAGPNDTLEVPIGLYCVYCKAGNTSAWQLDFGVLGVDWTPNESCRRGG